MTAVPDAGACKAYAGQASASWTDAQVNSALAAERRAQARVCRVPAAVDGQWPAGYDDLAEALMRRVQRNLAMRNVPLGVLPDEAGGVRPGSRDPEIRRLEGPFRKVRIG